jgi:NitT/TauT family transport system substrate-binding protein
MGSLTRRWPALAGLAVAVSLAVAGCGGDDEANGGGESAAEAGPTTVKIAYTRGAMSYAPFFVGIEQGLFEQEGLDVESVAFASGGDVATAILSGSVDFGVTGIDRPISLLSQGQEALQALAAVQDFPIFVLVGPKGSDLPAGDLNETMHALRGKKVGISGLGSYSEVTLAAALSEAGMSKNDVVLIETGLGSTALAALNQGTVDAYMAVEPDTSQIDALGIGERLLNFSDPEQVGEEFAGVPSSALLTAPEYVKSNAETAEKTVRALTASIAFMQENREEAVTLMSQTMNLEPAVAETIYDGEVVNMSTAVDEDQFARLAGMMASTGVIEKEPSYEEAVAVQFAPAWGQE